MISSPRASFIVAPRGTPNPSGLLLEEERGNQRVAFQTRLGEQVVKMTSTLVETVSINYEDFNESFLTCGTCLCNYDGGEHTPKLLPCSHTVCLHCLGRIAATAHPSSTTTLTSYTSSLSSGSGGVTREAPASFRCPICRESIIIPRGGVAALPPSFLVNQLLDLMASQRREVIPKCSIHSSQELLFCETCDTVFCAVCVPSPHNNLTSGDHTVIPFSIAIKRMSEILLYKANECIAKLNEASESVSEEVKKLTVATESAESVVNKAFEEAVLQLDKRRSLFLAKIRELADSKKEKLKDQLELIEKERAKVRQTCDGLEYQVEVRHITKKISELSSQLDSFVLLRHPRENAYLVCKAQSDWKSLEASICPSLQTSSTFPPLCQLSIGIDSLPIVGIQCQLLLETRDFHNDLRKEGGDPIQVSIATPKSHLIGTSKDKLELPLTLIQDNEDGTYWIKFTPLEIGRHEIHVKIFGRAIGNDGFAVEVSDHNNPIKTFGRGELNQPVGITQADHGETFVLDTGNGRIVVLELISGNNSVVRRILYNEALEGHSCTGIAYCNKSENLLIVNWRTQEVTRISSRDGSTLGRFKYKEFIEPIGIAVDGKGGIYVADNGARAIFCFDEDGHFKEKITRDGFELLGGVTVSPDGKTIVVADTNLFIIGEGNELKISSGTGIKGRYGGVTLDSDGCIIATRTEKSRTFVQIFRREKSEPIGMIDSFEAKLKRPSDVIVSGEREILVVDLGNDCVKQYRYK